MKPPWRNRLARSAVNRKVGGSSPPGGGIFLQIFPRKVEKILTLWIIGSNDERFKYRRVYFPTLWRLTYIWLSDPSPSDLLYFYDWSVCFFPCSGDRTANNAEDLPRADKWDEDPDALDIYEC